MSFCPSIAGSSPLTRGALIPDNLRNPVGGLIPAHAGSTAKRVTRYVTCGAHPRSRGEHNAWASVMAGMRGSSPLTRGAPSLSTGSVQARRLIPAHAGSTCHRREAGAALRAHPRSRGEHHDGSGNFSTSLGSSPLTRGAHLITTLDIVLRGLIPAHAGSTRRRTVG